jgi:hypothetical protein
MDLNSSLNSSKLSKKLKNHFKENIKLCLKNKTNLFIVTKNDIFYEIDIFGHDIQLFVSNDDTSIIEKMVLDELSHKKIVDLYWARNYNIARTEQNEFYYWGENYLKHPSYLRENTDSKNFIKPALVEKLSN